MILFLPFTLITTNDETSASSLTRNKPKQAFIDKTSPTNPSHAVNKFLFDFILLYNKRLNISSNNIDHS